MTAIKITTTIDKLNANEDAASVFVEAALERRDDAIETVLNSCIHNVSGAIRELGQAQEDYGDAISAWGIHYDKRVAAEQAATKH
jgi:hypothetical protein